eukprot:2678959-Lingulodinium_polyedra.AAC.1
MGWSWDGHGMVMEWSWNCHGMVIERSSTGHRTGPPCLMGATAHFQSSKTPPGTFTGSPLPCGEEPF